MNLSKFFLILVFILAPLKGFTQIEDIEINNQFTINRIYTGINANTLFEEDDLNTKNEYSFRIGSMVTYRIDRVFSIRSYGVMNIEDKKVPTSVGSYRLIASPHSNLSISIGLMATPITEIRPNPTTWESHVETNAQSNITGGMTGTKINWTINSKLSVVYGVFKHNEVVFYHGKISYQNISIGSYVKDKVLFSALDISTNKFNSTLTYAIEKEIAGSYFWNFHNNYSLYFDLEYSFITDQMKNNIWGIRKYYSSKDIPVSGFLSISYDYERKHLKGQLFVHL